MVALVAVVGVVMTLPLIVAWSREFAEALPATWPTKIATPPKPEMVLPPPRSAAVVRWHRHRSTR